MRVSDLRTLVSAAEIELADIEPSVKAEILRNSIQAAKAVIKDNSLETAPVAHKKYVQKQIDNYEKEINNLVDPIIGITHDDED